MPDIARVRTDFIQRASYEFASETILSAVVLVLFVRLQSSALSGLLVATRPPPLTIPKARSRDPQEHEWQRMSVGVTE